MKKLFSAMLAATMVAGASVTAFAYVDSKSDWDTGFFGDNDYAVIGAYDEDGEILKDKRARVDSGDKIYYPILISGDEIDKDVLTDNGKGEKMYFADKASEIKDLKASVKDEVGGKYIDSASIVKKDIKITDSGDSAFVNGFEDITVGQDTLDSAAKKANDKLEVTGTLTGGKTSVEVANATGVTAKIATKAEYKTYKVEIEAKAGVDGKSQIAEAAISGDTITVTVYGKWDGSAAAEGTVTVDAIKTAIEGKISETVKEITVSGEAKVDNAGKIIGTAPTASAKGVTKAGVETPVTVKVEYKRATAGKESNGGVEASFKDDTLKFVVTGKNENKATGNALNKKVYCVEVKMADYFKNEETEVEFNIKLKNKGKEEYNTDDDNKLFNGTFDLGQDSFILEHNKKYDGIQCKKFKNGDLEIKIGKDTKSVQLDEAIASNGKTEDIDNIYIENDDSIDSAFTFDVKASNQDDLYLELNQDAIKDLALSNQKADLTFFNFPGKPEFDFAGTATFAVEDEDEDNYFYEVIDGELVETKAKYNDDDGVFELRTNKLGSYVISDKELDTSSKSDKKDDDTENKEQEEAGGDLSADSTQNNGGKGNANTGAADLIGVASALAVVSVATAGVVALKK